MTSPKIEPYSTPIVILAYCELILVTTVHCIRLEK